MARITFAVGIVLVAAALAPAAPAPEKEPAPAVATAKKLARPVKFAGWEKDERMTLGDALDELARLYEVRFTVNETAFKADVPPVPEVMFTPVLDKMPLPKMDNVPLETVLRRLLDRVPTTSGTAFLIRRDQIEITTGQALKTEIWGENYRGPLLPLVHAVIERQPLEDALKELADAADFNIVVDARAAEKVKTPVTAGLINVPLDSAVRLLVDMADLKPFLVDNMLYVTTRENCARLEAEEKAKLPKRLKSQPEVMLGGPVSPPGPRVGAGRLNAVPPSPLPPPLLP